MSNVLAIEDIFIAKRLLDSMPVPKSFIYIFENKMYDTRKSEDRAALTTLIKSGKKLEGYKLDPKVLFPND